MENLENFYDYRELDDYLKGIRFAVHSYFDKDKNCIYVNEDQFLEDMVELLELRNAYKKREAQCKRLVGKYSAARAEATFYKKLVCILLDEGEC